MGNGKTGKRSRKKKKVEVAALEQKRRNKLLEITTFNRDVCCGGEGITVTGLVKI